MASLVNDLSNDFKYISNKCTDPLENRLLSVSVCLRVVGIAIAVFASIGLIKALSTISTLKILGSIFWGIVSHDAIVTGSNIRKAVSRKDMAAFNPLRLLPVSCSIEKFTKETFIANKIPFPPSWNF